MNPCCEELQKLFAEHGLRCTRQRKAVYRALLHSREHPTADELYRQLNGNGCARGNGHAHGKANGAADDDSSLSLATVYNTLEAFCRSGLAQRLAGAGENGSCRYDAVRDDHLHVRDRLTGRVTDVPDDLGRKLFERIPPELVEQVESRLGYRINQVHIELVGEPATDSV